MNNYLLAQFVNFKQNKPSSLILYIISAIILLKLCLIALFLYADSEQFKFDYKKTFLKKDYFEQINPTNNLVETGTWEKERFSNIPFTERLPGYIFPYVFFRFLFEENLAVSSLILFQIIISILSSLALFKIIKWISKSNFVSLICFSICNLFSFITYWEIFAVPDSLSVSYYIISIYFLFKHLYIENSYKYIFLAGFFMAMTFFLRGFLFFYIFSPIILFLNVKKFKSFIKYSLMLLLPFIIIEMSWIMRNYAATKKFIPLVSRNSIASDNQIIVDKNYDFDKQYKPSMLKLRNYISKWGGIVIGYYDGEMSYFLDYTDDIENNFPNWIFNRGVKKKNLMKIKNNVNESFVESYDFERRKQIEISLVDIVTTYSNEFRYDSFLEVIYVKLKRMKNLVGRNVTAGYPFGPFRENSLIMKFYKLGIISIYFMMVIIAIFVIPSFIIAKKGKHNVFYIFMYLNTLWLLFVFSFLVNETEFKYTATLFINGIVSSTPLLLMIINKVGVEKKSNIL